MLPKMAGPVHSIHQKDVLPAVTVEVNEGNTRPHCLRQIFLSERACVVDKANAGGLRDVTESGSRSRFLGWRGPSGQRNKTRQQNPGQK
jgi:hypothetical protein